MKSSAVLMAVMALVLGSSAVFAQEASEAEHAVAASLQSTYGTRNLLSRPRASKIHDRVTVVIDEDTSAKNAATTELTRDSSMDWSLNKWFTLSVDDDGNLVAKPRLQSETGTLSGSQKPEVNFSTSRDHEADGETERSQTFKSEVSGEVIDVLPNGQLVVEARSTIRLNEEEQVLIFTGRVEPRDLDTDNMVNAKYVIDRRIKFTGKGDISRMQKRGWGSKVLDLLNPF